MSSAPARVDELKKRYEENPRRFFAPLANEYRKAGDLEAAIDLCRMHLDEQPGHLSGHIVYGQALFESGRSGDARIAFEAALNLDPENLIALRHLGDIGKAEGDGAVAAHWYQRVLEADPRNDEVISLIAELQQHAAAPFAVASPVESPPPAPQYGVEAPPTVELQFIDSSAPTPVITIEAVSAAAPLSEPAPEPTAAPTPVPAVASPRGSIGLMDLDLDLGEEALPSADLLGTASSPPSAPTPAADGPLPVFTEDFSFADAAQRDVVASEPEPLAAADAKLDLSPPAGPSLEPDDTAFDVGLPAEQESTFAAVVAEPVFGDALDITVAPVAESVAATPADFDALFGTPPIADVFVGGDEAPVVAGEPGFIADAFVGRELVDAPQDASADVGTTPPQFVTETMAELYLQQGFHQEALEVYRQLSAMNPADASLAERVRHLEHGARSSMAIDRDSQEIEAAAIAEELRHSAEIPAIPEDVVAAVPEPAAEPDVVHALPRAVPAMLAEAPLVAAPVAPVAPPPPTGPTAREVLSRIAQRRATPLGGAASGGVEPTPESAAASHRGPAPGVVDVPSAPAISAPGGSIDHLFGAGPVTADDEGAAAAVAAAFDAAPAVTVRGQPTYAGTDELSLESVFHDEGGVARPAPAVERQSTRLRFDQFFAGTAEPADSSSSSTVPVPSVPGKGEEDIAQFNDWLKGLKGS